MAIYTSDHIGKWYLLDHSDLGYILTESYNCKIDREVDTVGKEILVQILILRDALSKIDRQADS